MTTLATYQDVEDLVSDEVKEAFGSSEALVNRYLERAEQTIVTETRRDWVDSYASVPTGVKETLRLCASNHAALKLTNKYKSAEFSRAAAITSLNVFAEEFNRTLRVLQNLDSVKIRSVS